MEKAKEKEEEEEEREEKEEEEEKVVEEEGCLEAMVTSQGCTWLSGVSQWEALSPYPG